MSKYFLGIDPGASGAIAVIGDKGYQVWDSHKEASMVATAFTKALIYCEKWEYRLAVIEDVHSMPKQGVSSTFSFGKNCGMWEALLCYAGIPWVRVAPTKWQRFFSEYDSGKAFERTGPRGNKKNRSLEIARRLFPLAELGRQKDNGRAEALLIALWLSKQK